LSFKHLKVGQRVIVNGKQDFTIENQAGVVKEFEELNYCDRLTITFDERFNDGLHSEGLRTYHLYSDDFFGTVTLHGGKTKYLTAWEDGENYTLTGDDFDTEAEAAAAACFGLDVPETMIVLKIISRHEARSTVSSVRLSD